MGSHRNEACNACIHSHHFGSAHTFWCSNSPFDMGWGRVTKSSRRCWDLQTSKRAHRLHQSNRIPIDAHKTHFSSSNPVGGIALKLMRALCAGETQAVGWLFWSPSETSVLVLQHLHYWNISTRRANLHQQNMRVTQLGCPSAPVILIMYQQGLVLYCRSPQ